MSCGRHTFVLSPNKEQWPGTGAYVCNPSISGGPDQEHTVGSQVQPHTWRYFLKVSAVSSCDGFTNLASDSSSLSGYGEWKTWGFHHSFVFLGSCIQKLATDQGHLVRTEGLLSPRELGDTCASQDIIRAFGAMSGTGGSDQICFNNIK
jgi:hypothetical protein